jgi:hypothetical protein
MRLAGMPTRRGLATASRPPTAVPSSHAHSDGLVDGALHPTYTSRANPIEAPFGLLLMFV